MQLLSRASISHLYSTSEFLEQASNIAQLVLTKCVEWPESFQLVAPITHYTGAKLLLLHFVCSSEELACHVRFDFYSLPKMKTSPK